MQAGKVDMCACNARFSLDGNRIFLPADLLFVRICRPYSLVPRPLSEKSRRGLATRTTSPCPRALYSARQSGCRVYLRHVNQECATMASADNTSTLDIDKALDVASRCFRSRERQ